MGMQAEGTITVKAGDLLPVPPTLADERIAETIALEKKQDAALMKGSKSK